MRIKSSMIYMSYRRIMNKRITLPPRHVSFSEIMSHDIDRDINNNEFYYK